MPDSTEHSNADPTETHDLFGQMRTVRVCFFVGSNPLQHGTLPKKSRAVSNFEQPALEKKRQKATGRLYLYIVDFEPIRITRERDTTTH